jgi:predicted metal-binding membrane protein
MWVFITARLRAWLLFAVAIPVLTVVLHAVRRAVEARSGQTRLTRALAQLEDLGRRKRRRR